jgi:hypothetical protein
VTVNERVPGRSGWQGHASPVAAAAIPAVASAATATVFNVRIRRTMAASLQPGLEKR